MYQILFRIPFLNLPIYSYGVMLVVAFLACIAVAKAMARRKGIDPEVIVNIALIALVAGVAGARLSDIFENWSTFTDPARSFLDNFLDAINIRNGGLTFYGGFILAIPCCLGYAKLKGLKLLQFADLVAPVVMVGLGFGRIGCYLNGCCYGEICRPTFLTSVTQFPYDSYAYIDQFDRGLIQPPAALVEHLTDGTVALKSWSQVKAEGLTALADHQKALPVQPTELYSSLTNFLLAALLWAFWTVDHTDGRVFALLMLLEGPARFILELIRVEPAVLIGKFAGISVDMSLSMVLGLLVFAAGAVMWVALGCWKRWNSRPSRRIFAAAH
jgi:phosphatidylglycerol---prolipoprotein diacylglyceryl transferase